MVSSLSNYHTQIDYEYQQLLKSLSPGWKAGSGGWHRLWFEPLIKLKW
jgi:hypothetical protein